MQQAVYTHICVQTMCMHCTTTAQHRTSLSDLAKEGASESSALPLLGEREASSGLFREDKHYSSSSSEDSLEAMLLGSRCGLEAPRKLLSTGV